MEEETPTPQPKRSRGRPRKIVAETPAQENPAMLCDEKNICENLESELSMAESPEMLLEAARRLAMSASQNMKKTIVEEKAPVLENKSVADEKPQASALNPRPRQEGVPAETLKPELHYPSPENVPEPRKLPAWALRAPSASQTVSRFAPRPQMRPAGVPAGTAPRFSSGGPAKKPLRFGAPAVTAPNYTKLANRDSTEIPALKLGEKFDLNNLNNEEYLSKLAQRAAHTKKIMRREVPNANPNDPFARAEITQIVEELVDDVPAEPLALAEFYGLHPGKLREFAEALNVKNTQSLNRSNLILNILREAYIARRPILITGTLDLLEYNGNGLLLYACENYERVEFSAFVPALLIKKYNLKRGHRVKGVAFPPMPGETAPMIVSILEVEGCDPVKVAELPDFSSLTPVYPDRRIRLESETLSEKSNLAMRVIDLICPIGYGQRLIINAPEGFDRVPIMKTLARALSENAADAEITTLLIDAHREDIALFRKEEKKFAIVASDNSKPDETHVHIAEMTIEHARRRAELGKHTIILLDSLTRLARAYNNLRSNGQKFVSGSIDILTLTKPKNLFSAACNYSNGGSITIIASLTTHSPVKAKEIVFEEFDGTSNAKLTLVKKAEFPQIDIANTSNRREELLMSEKELALENRIRKNTEEMPVAEALEALLNDIRGSKNNEELIAKQ
ncbi:MAG: hypothetical protein K6B46_05690 [Opitutales bacterium]|nr:hypothetical protein [Opitutales bacterium]